MSAVAHPTLGYETCHYCELVHLASPRAQLARPVSSDQDSVQQAATYIVLRFRLDPESNLQNLPNLEHYEQSK